MTEQVCQQCGGAIRAKVAAGLCPRCLLLRALPSPPKAAPQPAALSPDRAVGPFFLLEEIARGGMGVVYRAREEPLGRIVALKLLRGGELSASDFLVRFHNEARAASSLIHSHIVPVYAFGEDAGIWYIAMRLMEGGSLAGWIRSHHAQGKNGAPHATVKHREAAILVTKLARAVHYAHERGILHRDLKPENVLLDSVGEPFLTDFGLARLNESDERVTRSHISLGTPAYIAPEVVREGSSNATVSSDIYGLGALFYELLTGRPPFSGATPLEVLRQVTDSEPRLPSTISKSLQRDLETICLKAMAREPRLRYESCAAFAKDLDRWLTGQPIEARPTSRAERVLKWARRRPVVASLVLLLSVSVLVNAIGSWIVNRNLRVASERQRVALVQSSVATANRLLSQHDPAGSLPFQIASIRMESGHPEREAMQRRRLALSLPDLPHLDRVWRHDGPVNTVAFSPDGAKILSASDDGTARIWDVAGQSQTVILKHDKRVIQALLSPDGQRILTLCADGLARCWNAVTGQPVSGPWPIRLAYYHMPLNPNASFSPDGRKVIAVSATGLNIWNADNGALAFPPIATNNNYDHAAFSPDGKRIVASREDGKVEVWELTPAGANLVSSYRHPMGALYASFSPDNRHVLSVGKDNKAVLWTADTGKEIATLAHHDLSSRIAQAIFAPGGEHLMTLSFDHSIKVWDGVTGAPFSIDMNHPKSVADARWDPAGQRLVSASFDGMARIWDVPSGQIVGAILPHERYVIDTAFSPSGASVVTACMDNCVRVWSLGPGVETVLSGSGKKTLAFQSLDGALAAVEDNNNVLRVLDLARPGAPALNLPHSRPLQYGAFSPGGNRIAGLGEHGRIYLWDARNGSELASPKDAGVYFGALAFDPTGERIATVGHEIEANTRTVLIIWNARTLASNSFPIENDGYPVHIEFSPDGQFVLTSAGQGMVRVHDANTGREILPAINLGKEAGAAHFSRDGRLISTVVTGEGFEAGEARLWSAATHQQVGPPLPHEDGVPVSLFSPDGHRLATGAEDATARIWSVSSGQPLTPPMPHDGAVRTLLFTPDGQILATATVSQIRLWDASTGNALMPSQEIPGGVASLQFAAATSQLIAVGGDGAIRRWNFSPASQTLPELERMSTGLNVSKPQTSSQLDSSTPQ